MTSYHGVMSDSTKVAYPINSPLSRNQIVQIDSSVQEVCKYGDDNVQVRHNGEIWKLSVLIDDKSNKVSSPEFI
jgi:hypothetical protein